MTDPRTIECNGEVWQVELKESAIGSSSSSAGFLPRPIHKRYLVFSGPGPVRLRDDDYVKLQAGNILFADFTDSELCERLARLRGDVE